jgi:putative FmdB family regulatory protein
MPTYDYRCAKCGEDLEVYQTFSEKPLTRHKGCGGKLSKVLSPAGIVLKGSGFYKTDNRSSSGKRSSSSDSNGKDSGQSGSSSDSSAKPESGKSDTKSSSDSKSSESSSSDSKKPAAKSA